MKNVSTLYKVSLNTLGQKTSESTFSSYYFPSTFTWSGYFRLSTINISKTGEHLIDIEYLS